MPECGDPERAKLILGMAKRESIAAAEAVLEKGVAYQDKKRIETATAMLQDILNENRDSARKNDIRQAWDHGYDGVVIPFSKSRDAFFSTKRGENLRAAPCKPEDCKTCFWKVWCEVKESFDFMKKVNETLEVGRKLVAESEAKLRHRDTKQTWNAESSVEADRGKAGEAGRRLSLPRSVETEGKAECQRRRDWRIVRKMAKDTLDKARRDN